MRRGISLVASGLIGWVICGVTVGIGRELLSTQTALIVHAIVAPVAFGLLAWRHFRAFPSPSPFFPSLALLAVVMAMDLFVVAPFIEGSYAMFGSILGTWVPFASILGVSYIIGRSTKARSDMAACPEMRF
jgi:hypothetical protein